MEKVFIEITNITRVQRNAKDTGRPFTITEIVDGKTGRKGKTFDAAWSANWKIGDTIEAIWGKTDEYKGVTTWTLDNPSKPAGGGGKGFGGSRTTSQAQIPMLVYSFQIAAFLAPVLLKTGEVNLDRIEKLALAVKAKLEKDPAFSGNTASVAAPAAAAQVKEKTPAATVEAPVAQKAEVAPAVDEIEDFTEEPEEELF